MAEVNTKVPAPEKKLKKESQTMAVIKRILKNPTATVGFALFIALVLMAIFGPMVSPYNYAQMDMKSTFQFPSLKHPCGTDNLGRDLLTRIMFGARYSLSMGFAAVIFSAAVGIVLGACVGYFGGTFDNLVMRFLDIFQAIPGMLLTIAISTALGTGVGNTILAMSISRMPGLVRITRSAVMKIRGDEFLEAAEAIGCSHFRRIFVHTLPNSLAPVIVEVTMGVANTILALSSLSYVGLGVQPPIPEWGALLSGGKLYIRTYPYMIIFPGLIIAITVLALNLAGDGLRDALDPKLKQ